MKKILLLIAFLFYSNLNAQDFYSALLSSPKPVYDTDAQTYFTSVEAIEGRLPNGTKKALSTFVTTLKTNSLWTKIHFLHLSFAETFAGYVVPLKSDAGVNITTVNFSNYHYNPVLGIIGNSTGNGYLNLQYKVTDSPAITATNFNFTTNANYVSVGVAAYFIGASDGTNEVSMKNTNNVTCRILSKSPSAGGRPIGFVSVTSDATGTRLSRDNAAINTVAGAASGTMPAINVAALALNNNGTFSATAARDNSVDFEMVSESFTLSELNIIRLALISLRAAQKNHYANVSAGSLNTVLQYGQSLSLGYQAPATSLSASSINKMLNVGLSSGTSGALTGFTSIVPMVEAVTETGIYSFSEAITDAYPTHKILGITSGIVGQPYNIIAKGQVQYGTLLTHFFSMWHIAKSSGYGYPNLRAVNFIHGETDDLNNNASYDLNIATLQSNIESDIGSVTGKIYLPFIISQSNAWTNYSTRATPVAAPLQTKAVETAWTAYQTALASNSFALPKIVMACPKYFLPYTDGVHLTSNGYRWMMSYHAKVYKSMIINGTAWTGLRPLSVVRVSNVITIQFYVPVPPLRFNTTLVTDNTGGNKGFEFYAGTAGNTPVITSVVLGGDGTSVVITLDVAPTGTNPEIRYSWTGTAGAAAGPTTGARGNLCDSDATTDRWGNDLRNWCVTFNKIVP
jgi:hypothetical protein